MAAPMPFTCCFVAAFAVLALQLSLETADCQCMYQASLRLHLCPSLAVLLLLFAVLVFQCSLETADCYCMHQART